MVGRIAKQTVSLAAAALALTGVSSTRAFAQDHAHAATAQGGLVDVVREAAARFKGVSVAEAEEYGRQCSCVNGMDFGAMGLHFVNFPMVLDGEVDARHPEIVIYETLPDWRGCLVGVGFSV